MTKILPASCEDGVVTVAGQEIEGAIILSAGEGASQGIAIMDGDKVYYLPTGGGDLNTTLDSVISALEDVSQALTRIGTSLTSIGTGMTGPTTAPPGTLGTDVTFITARATEIDAAIEDLEALKGDLA